MNFGHPLRAAHASPSLCEGEGNGVLCFSLVSRVRGNDVGGYCGELRASPCSLRSRPPSRSEGGDLLLIAVFFVAALLSLESGEGFCVVYLDSLAVLGGLVLGEGVSECVGFVGALHPVRLDDVFGFE